MLFRLSAILPDECKDALQERGATAPVSHQKRPKQSTTNAIEFEGKLSKINETGP